MARTMPTDGVEAQINTMQLFILGVAKTIKALDPKLLDVIKDGFTDLLCKEGGTDLDKMLFARFAALEPRVSSPRAINCGLSGRTTEDIVLWSLLDAWNASGREPLSALPDIARHMKDDRTQRRLLPLEEQRRLKIARSESARTQN